MRHILKAAFLAMALLAGAQALAADPITLHPIRISPHVYYVQGEAGMASQANKGFMSNAGFVVTGDGVLVFDALATPVLGQALVQAIHAITPQPIRRVIVSHYHADHFYGLQALKAAGAEVWANRRGKATLESDDTKLRFEQRLTALAPWVDRNTRLVPADRWVAFDKGSSESFELGGLHFQLIDSGGAHSPEDTMLYVAEDKVLFAGDLFVTGRIPFVGTADTGRWLAALDTMLRTDPAIVVPGHGSSSSQPRRDMQMTRDYLLLLRKSMGGAVADLTPFDEAYAAVDWGAFKDYPAFDQANRINAYDTYLRMEQESLAAPAHQP